LQLSLREALENLDKDRGFLKNGGVFDDDFIDAYIELKMTRSRALRNDPAPGRIRHVLFAVILAALGAADVKRQECERRSNRSAFCFGGQSVYAAISKGTKGQRTDLSV
jgi:hypothetical protein